VLYCFSQCIALSESHGHEEHIHVVGTRFMLISPHSPPICPEYRIEQMTQDSVPSTDNSIKFMPIGTLICCKRRMMIHGGDIGEYRRMTHGSQWGNSWRNKRWGILLSYRHRFLWVISQPNSLFQLELPNNANIISMARSAICI